jgi:amino acid transporter
MEEMVYILCIFFFQFIFDKKKKKKKKKNLKNNGWFTKLIFFFFFLNMFTQGKKKWRFEFVTSASLGVVYSRLSYPLETIF